MTEEKESQSNKILKKKRRLRILNIKSIYSMCKSMYKINNDLY